MTESRSSTVFTKSSLLEFVAKNSDNTYIAIHENIYDVTPFLDEHPGGEEALKEHKIKESFVDATVSFEDVGHSMDARDMMQKYRIGSLEGKSDKPARTAQKKETENKSGFNLTWIVPLALIGVAIFYQFWPQRH